MFQPFENDHQSMQIGEIIFENQTDKVIVYGDIDIMASPIGLEQALKLQRVFTDIATALKEKEKEGFNLSKCSNDKDDINQTNNIDHCDSSKTIDNPFS